MAVLSGFVFVSKSGYHFLDSSQCYKKGREPNFGLTDWDLLRSAGILWKRLHWRLAAPTCFLSPWWRGTTGYFGLSVLLLSLWDGNTVLQGSSQSTIILLPLEMIVLLGHFKVHIHIPIFPLEFFIKVSTFPSSISQGILFIHSISNPHHVQLSLLY